VVHSYTQYLHTLALIFTWSALNIALMRTAVRGGKTEYLSSCRAARVLGVSKRTLLNWINSGLVAKPDVNPTNGYLLWTTADIEAARIARMEDRSDSTGNR
jgi:hypothetical protein